MQYLFSGPKISVLKTTVNVSKMIFAIYFEFKKCDYDQLDTLANHSLNSAQILIKEVLIRFLGTNLSLTVANQCNGLLHKNTVAAKEGSCLSFYSRSLERGEGDEGEALVRNHFCFGLLGLSQALHPGEWDAHFLLSLFVRHKTLSTEFLLVSSHLFIYFCFGISYTSL